MDPSVSTQLRVERRRHNSSLPNGDGIAAFSRNDLDAGAEAFKLGRANEYHLDRRAIQFPFADGAFELTPVGIAADADIEDTQTGLFRILDFIGKKDCAGAGAEGWFHADELLQLLESSFAQQLQEG